MVGPVGGFVKPRIFIMLTRRSVHDYATGPKYSSIEAPLSEMEVLFGEPWWNPKSFPQLDLKGQHYPDDEFKTDVCWSLDTPDGWISIWNYKNGPAYNRHEPNKMPNYFSVTWQNNEAHEFLTTFLIDSGFMETSRGFVKGTLPYPS